MKKINSIDGLVDWLHNGKHQLGGHRGIQKDQDFKIRTSKGVKMIVFEDVTFTKKEKVIPTLKRNIESFNKKFGIHEFRDKRYAVFLIKDYNKAIKRG